jgi:hypothetical protein
MCKALDSISSTEKKKEKKMVVLLLLSSIVCWEKKISRYENKKTKDMLK